MRNSIKLFLFLLVITSCFMNMQCEDDDVDVPICNYVAVVDKLEYDAANSNGVTFVGAEINGDCLSLVIGASGCDGETWGFALIDSGDVAESSPEQRFLKLDFTNEEVCDAFFERIVSFQLNSVRVVGSKKVILHIEGLDQELEYNY